MTPILQKRYSRTTPLEGNSVQTPSLPGLTINGRSWVFTLKNVQSSKNAFNKETTRKPPLSGTATKVNLRAFTLKN
jgi:hypothetical protein